MVGVVVRPTAAAISASEGDFSTVPSGGTSTGTSSAVAPAASSSRAPSGSSMLYQRYGTALRARKSRAANDSADQRWPSTFVSSTERSPTLRQVSIRASTTGYSFSSGGSHGLSR